MITAELQHDWLQQRLAGKATSSAHYPAWLVAARDQASLALNALPVLDRKLEDWRYTSVENLLKLQFEPADVTTTPASDVQPADIQQHFIDGLDTHRIVLLNGRYAPHLSGDATLPAGLKLESIRDVLAADPDMLATWFGQTAQHNEQVFTALNTALMNDGVLLHVNSGVVLERPIEIIYIGTDSEHTLLLQPRNLVVLDEGASATLIERFIGNTDTVYFHNHVSEIVVGSHASLKHYRIQYESRQAYHLSSVYLSQQAESYYHGTTLSFGGAWNRTEYHTAFKQENAVCNLNGLCMVGDKQLSDFHLKVHHAVPGCTSREHFKGILYGKGRAVFDGYIHVDKLAQRSDAELTNDNLMLTRDAEVDTRPQLEIYADDVKCSHGTTIGELDQQQIFYLRSRGIDEVTARKMLCIGFANNIIDSIDIPALHDDAVIKLNDTLNTAVISRL